MTDHESMLAAIKSQEKMLEKQNVQLSNIEKSLVTMAVQEKEISHINSQLHALWSKYDQAFESGGVISKLQECAASCPREQVQINLSRQWVAIGAIIALVAAIKLFG